MIHIVVLALIVLWTLRREIFIQGLTLRAKAFSYRHPHLVEQGPVNPTFEFQNSVYQRCNDLVVRIHKDLVQARLLLDRGFQYRQSQRLASRTNLGKTYRDFMKGLWIPLELPKGSRPVRISVDHSNIMCQDDQGRRWFLALFVFLQNEKEMMPDNYNDKPHAKRRLRWKRAGKPRSNPDRPQSGITTRYLALGVNTWRCLGCSAKGRDWQFSRVNFAGEAINSVYSALREMYVGGPYQGDVIHYGISMDATLSYDGRSILFRDLAVFSGVGIGLKYRIFLPANNVGIKMDYSNTILTILSRGPYGIGFWTMKSNTDYHGYSPVPKRKVQFENLTNHNGVRWKWIPLPPTGLDSLSDLFRASPLGETWDGNIDHPDFSLCVAAMDQTGYWKYNTGSWSWIADPNCCRELSGKSLLDRIDDFPIPVEQDIALTGILFGQKATIPNWDPECNVWSIYSSDQYYQLHRVPDSWSLLTTIYPSRWFLLSEIDATEVRVKLGRDFLKIYDGDCVYHFQQNNKSLSL